MLNLGDSLIKCNLGKSSNLRTIAERNVVWIAIFKKDDDKGRCFLKKNTEICASCENYFWKSQLSILPCDSLRFRHARKFCPRCYLDALGKYALEKNAL